MVAECEKDKRVKGINLSRNFGQHYAITAGLHYAKGEWVVVMDCDLQDRPDEIPNLYKKAQEGYYIVQARRKVRQDGFFKRITSKLFHSIYSFLIEQRSDSTIANFGIYHHTVIEKFNALPERSRSFGTLISFLGFTKTSMDVRHSERYEGKSSYSFAKLLNLAFDVALANSNRPLKLTIKFGFILSFLSFLLAFYNVFARIAGIIQIDGYTTTVFSIWFVGGLIISILGMLGLYIGKIFDEVKRRPLFVVQDFINID